MQIKLFNSHIINNKSMHTKHRLKQSKKVVQNLLPIIKRADTSLPQEASPHLDGHYDLQYIYIHS